MYKVGFILNGKSRSKKRFYRELNLARRNLRETEFNVVETTEPGHAVSLASEFINEGYTHLIAIGGDGTVHELINGIMKNYSSEVIVGVLPFGSANDFVKSVKGPSNLTELFQSILEVKFTSIDIGKIEHGGGVRYFNNIADFGIGAEVVKRVNSSSKFFGARLTFFKAIVESFFSYVNKSIVCKTPEWTKEGKMNSVVVANGRFFGNGMCIAPNAELSDAQFEVVIIGDISTRDYLKNMNDVKVGKELNHPKVQYLSAKRLEISSTEKCGIEADGEFIGYTPATVSIEAEKIKLLKG